MSGDNALLCPIPRGSNLPRLRWLRVLREYFCRQLQTQEIVLLSLQPENANVHAPMVNFVLESRSLFK